MPWTVWRLGGERKGCVEGWKWWEMDRREVRRRSGRKTTGNDAGKRLEQPGLKSGRDGHRVGRVGLQAGRLRVEDDDVIVTS